MSPLSLRLAGSLLPLVAIASGVSLYANQTGICQQVDSQLPGRVSYSGSSAYISSQSDYYTGEERDLQPGCVFRPTKTSDISHLVKLVAASNNTSTPEFAVRCGGHSFFAGAANIDGGVTIDLRSLDLFELSADRKTASVGGGSIWSEDVYPNLVPHNLTVAGGRITGVGVGGFLTGGGLNYLERRNGFACDNIYGYEVVLGTGEVVYASADSNRDLWLALKGGSNNFGIVTRFDLATYTQGLMLGGYINFNVTQTVLDDHAKAFSSWMDPQNFDPSAVMEFNLVWSSGAWSLADAIYYLSPDLTPSVYEEFFAIPGQIGNNLALKNVTAIVEESAALVPTTVSRAIQLNYSFKNGNASTYSQLIQTIMDAVGSISDVEGLVLDFLMQPHPVTNGTNSLGLSPNETDRVIVDIGAAYNNAADDKIVDAAVQGMFDQHVRILQDAGVFLNFTYLNYAGANQDPIGSYGDLASLQGVSKKYDPHGIFQAAVPGAFKLFKQDV